MSTLPNLPTKHNKPEAHFGEQLVKHVSNLKEPFFNYPCWIEIKETTDNVFYYRQLEELQVSKLLKIKNEGLLIRITEASSNGSHGIPDYAWTYKQPAYVGIRYAKSWCFIDIETFVMERDRSKKKSLSESRAVELAIKVINKGYPHSVDKPICTNSK
jgi:hypothetical protein